MCTVLCPNLTFPENQTFECFITPHLNFTFNSMLKFNFVFLCWHDYNTKFIYIRVTADVYIPLKKRVFKYLVKVGIFIKSFKETTVMNNFFQTAKKICWGKISQILMFYFTHKVEDFIKS